MRFYGLGRNCTQCNYWLRGSEQCDKFKARPPVEVIVKGCEHFDEGIPF